MSKGKDPMPLVSQEFYIDVKDDDVGTFDAEVYEPALALAQTTQVPTDPPCNIPSPPTPTLPVVTSNLTILIWTQFLRSRPTWFDKPDAEAMDKCHKKGLVQTRGCEFTYDKTRVGEADAVLFRGRLLRSHNLPDRTPNQKWIFFENEPPHKTWIIVNLTEFNGLFNMTATPAFDSDIPLSIHRNYHKNYETYDKLKHVDYAAKKRSDVPVAWFVSRCITQSKREDYVQELQKYISVDIYGACGNLTCEYSTNTFKEDHCIWELLHAKNSYKFYLAFENSLCEDYVTEKLWKVMGVDVVPIVMGAVTYGNILPKNSFIDVRDYDSPKHLADYLHYLNNNDAAYNQYLRNKGSLKASNVGMLPLQCTICMKLHEAKDHITIVHELDAFWSSRRCIPPKDFFKYRALNDFDLDFEHLLRTNWMG